VHPEQQCVIIDDMIMILETMIIITDILIISMIIQSYMTTNDIHSPIGCRIMDNNNNNNSYCYKKAIQYI
jgi:hypothetical protein